MSLWAPQCHQEIADDSPGSDNFRAETNVILSRRGFLQRSASLLAALPILPFPIGEAPQVAPSKVDPVDGGKDADSEEPGDSLYQSEDLVAARRETECLFLTFDDGPLHCTSAILDQLAEREQKATFFVIGRNLTQPALRKLALRAIQEGHEIGNHSFTHPAFSEISSEQVEQEITRTHKQIIALFKESGLKEDSQRLFFRFPYGDAGSIYNYYNSMNILAELGYSIAWWDVDTHDWRLTYSRAERTRTRVMASFERAGARDVVLLHDRRGTADLLPSLLDVMQSKSLVSMCLSAYDEHAAETGVPREVKANPVEIAPEPAAEPDASETSPLDELLWEEDEETFSTDDSVSS